MRRAASGALVLLLASLTQGVDARENWWRPEPNPATASEAAPAVTLGRPVALSDNAPASTPPKPFPDIALSHAVYTPASWNAPIIQTQASAPPPATLSPLPPAANDPYACGVANQAPDANPGFWSKCKEFCGGFPWIGKGAFDSTNTHHLFVSDHEFDGFISPVSNPFYFEDPRSLTEIKPIFIFQQAPGKNKIFHGGDIEFFGVAGSVALTECWSIVVNKLGVTWMEPHNSTAAFQPHDGFSEIFFGPKFTFLRNESTKTLGAVGLTIDIPAGDRSVFQDTGSLSLVPYVSMAQSFWSTSYGSMQAMGTLGYNLAVDNKRSDDLFLSLHLDYDIGNLHKIYPLLEMNFFYYTSNGKANAVNFEGRDLFNFGSTSISGHTEVSLAAGARYKINESIQLGLVGEAPLTNQSRGLMAYRVTFDVIFRY